MNLINSRYVLCVRRGGEVLAGLYRRMCSFLLGDNLHHRLTFYLEIVLCILCNITQNNEQRSYFIVF